MRSQSEVRRSLWFWGRLKPNLNSKPCPKYQSAIASVLGESMRYASLPLRDRTSTPARPHPNPRTGRDNAKTCYRTLGKRYASGRLCNHILQITFRPRPWSCSLNNYHFGDSIRVTPKWCIKSTKILKFDV